MSYDQRYADPPIPWAQYKYAGNAIPVGAQPPDREQSVSRQEFDALRREVDELRQELRKALFDRDRQPRCTQ